MESAKSLTARSGSVSVPQGDRGGRVLPAKNRAKATNNPFFVPSAPNPRARDRRRRDLIAVFIEELGGPGAVDAWTLVNVRKAAELTALVEQDRAAMLRGANIDRDQHIKLEGEARRAIRALGLKIDKPKSEFSPLRHRLKKEAEAKAAAAIVGGQP